MSTSDRLVLERRPADEVERASIAATLDEAGVASLARERLAMLDDGASRP